MSVIDRVMDQLYRLKSQLSKITREDLILYISKDMESNLHYEMTHFSACCYSPQEQSIYGIRYIVVLGVTDHIHVTLKPS
jgi:hypothetical protein